MLSPEVDYPLKIDIDRWELICVAWSYYDMFVKSNAVFNFWFTAKLVKDSCFFIIFGGKHLPCNFNSPVLLNFSLDRCFFNSLSLM